MESLNVDDWIQQLSIEQLEKLESIIKSNKTTPTGNMKVFLRSYLDIHVDFIKLKDRFFRIIELTSSNGFTVGGLVIELTSSKTLNLQVQTRIRWCFRGLNFEVQLV